MLSPRVVAGQRVHLQSREEAEIRGFLTRQVQRGGHGGVAHPYLDRLLRSARVRIARRMKHSPIGERFFHQRQVVRGAKAIDPKQGEASTRASELVVRGVGAGPWPP